MVNELPLCKGKTQTTSPRETKVEAWEDGLVGGAGNAALTPCWLTAVEKHSEDFCSPS